MRISGVDSKILNRVDADIRIFLDLLFGFGVYE